MEIVKLELKHLDAVALAQTGMTPATALERFAVTPAAVAEANSGSPYAPKEEDYVRQVFRALSATTIASGTWRASYFPEDVLKKSVPLLKNQAVYKDHDTRVDNWVGIIEDAVFVPATKTKLADGRTIEVPAGIDVLVKLDARLNEKIARGMLMQPPAIHSVSVTVEFQWEPSHSFGDPGKWDDWRYQFLDAVGSKGADGKQVVRKAVKVMGYNEVSLVWMGADPFAKQIGADGKPANIDAPRVYTEKYSKEESLKLGRYEASFALSQDVVSSLQDTPEKTPENGMTIEQLTAERDSLKAAMAEQQKTADAAVKAHETLTAQLAAQTAEVAALKAKVSEAEAKLEADKPLVEAGNVALTELRAELKRVYTIAANGAPLAEALVAQIEKSDYAALKAMAQLQGNVVTQQFAPTCLKCGTGEHVSFQKGQTAPEAKAPVVDSRNMTADEFYREQKRKEFAAATATKKA